MPNVINIREEPVSYDNVLDSDTDEYMKKSFLEKYEELVGHFAVSMDEHLALDQAKDSAPELHLF